MNIYLACKCGEYEDLDDPICCDGIYDYNNKCDACLDGYTDCNPEKGACSHKCCSSNCVNQTCSSLARSFNAQRELSDDVSPTAEATRWNLAIVSILLLVFSGSCLLLGALIGSVYLNPNAMKETKAFDKAQDL